MSVIKQIGPGESCYAHTMDVLRGQQTHKISLKTWALDLSGAGVSPPGVFSHLWSRGDSRNGKLVPWVTVQSVECPLSV